MRHISCSLIFTDVYLTLTEAHSCAFMFTHVHWCTLTYINVMFTHIHWYILTFTDVHSLTLMFTHVHWGSLMFTHDHSYSLTFSNVHSCSLMITNVHSCTLMSTGVHSLVCLCTLVFTHVYSASLMHTNVHSYLPIIPISPLFHYCYAFFVYITHSSVHTKHFWVSLSEDNLSSRKMCQRTHLFLGNSILPDRIYCPPGPDVPCKTRHCAISMLPWTLPTLH